MLYRARSARRAIASAVISSNATLHHRGIAVTSPGRVRKLAPASDNAVKRPDPPPSSEFGVVTKPTLLSEKKAKLSENIKKSTPRTQKSSAGNLSESVEEEATLQDPNSYKLSE
jgi:uncharacterized protein YbjT (DUF2867 family)